MPFKAKQSGARLGAALVLFLGFTADVSAQPAPQVAGEGPFSGSFIASGLGIKKRLPPAAIGDGTSPWSLYGWVNASELPGNTSLIAGLGDVTSPGDAQRYFALKNGSLSFWYGGDQFVSSTTRLPPGSWHFVAATFDGKLLTLYADGSQAAQSDFVVSAVAPIMQLAPADAPAPTMSHFAGKLVDFTFVDHALPPDKLQATAAKRPDFDNLQMEAGSKSWPIQTRAQAGYRAPQDPATLPKSSAPFQKPGTAKVTNISGEPLRADKPNQWTLAGGWRLAAAPDVKASANRISQPGFDAAQWYTATVPGTVLTTLVDQGVYPDPDFGLNNLAIPEKLNRQDYWYRTEFKTPATGKSQRLTLTFEGINYAAEVWLNGKRLGAVKGAFIRGIFDVTDLVASGRSNALAVKITPPPHPGIPQEQSVKGGPGENGGAMCLDGPTFIDTEGWDWIPAIRDRNVGIWQQVTLTASGTVKIGDPQVITRLPLPDTSRAEIALHVPLRNQSGAPVNGVIHASFEGVEISKRVTVAPGETLISMNSSEFPQLSLAHPRLWWPNGYGSPELYHLKVSFNQRQSEDDSKSLQFGIREITYELSLLDATGHLRRVEYSPTSAGSMPVVDVTHEGMIESANGWVASLRAGAETSSAIRTLDDLRLTPYLVVRVNGVRIACKGGNWGMEDSRKRVSREKLEPYFRLHRDANLNIIRNWCGQNTEEVFFQLADEYGLLVWNDFWESTQNYNVEPSDSALFLTNARDTILRFRNHPSILLWCGRNEGVPSPAVNEGLDQLIHELDGTRYYSPSSNVVNLQNSGPYKYNAPETYFTQYGHGFAVELGVPSVPTLDTLRSMMAPADQWPPNDTWAYHDWHQSGNGDVAPFMAALNREFGAPSSLEDFERKAQMLNYVTHRAIFEGFNSHLWSQNSGRLLWMTQPAWPSTMWQILSSDYDTQASFYGVKKASEKIHVQLNLPDLRTAVVNNTTEALRGLTLQTQALTVAGKITSTHSQKLDAAPNAVTNGDVLDLKTEGLTSPYFIKQTLTASDGQILSDNFYWYSPDDSSYRDLNKMAKVKLTGSASQARAGDMVRLTVQLSNAESEVALMTKLTLRDGSGLRVLPAYYSDNYVSLLPGEKGQITIECPASKVKGDLNVSLSGWNLTEEKIPAKIS